MLSNQQKASIHIAKNERGMSDQDYRALLKELTGAVSSTDPKLSDQDYQAIMKAIRNKSLNPGNAPSPGKPGEHGNSNKPDATTEEGNKKGGCNTGWKDTQVRKFRQYVRFCRMDITEARGLLYKTVGAMNEESPHLKQVDFDDAMAAIEAILEARVQAGHASPPQNIHLKYWRNRHPKRGGVNTREAHLIFELWKELKSYLSTEKQNMQYLLGFAAHTCRFSRAKTINELSAREALKVIDALKRRLTQERRSVALDVQKNELENELAEVPF